MGRGSRQKMMHQQETPARNGIQVTSALPQACKTAPRAMAMPAQTGSRRSAIKNLSHLSTRQIKRSGVRMQIKIYW
jgi:hypothetical protein